MAMLVMLSAFAGAVHVMAPDHWVPASVLSWRRRWDLSQVAWFSSAVLTLHVLLGAGIYFIFDDSLRALNPEKLFPYSLAFVAGVMFLRGFRFWRIQEIQRVGPHKWWAHLAVVSLLGPCESIIPIFLKSASLGFGYVIPLMAFLLGTVGAGMLLILAGQQMWNRPRLLIFTFDWANRRIAALPVVAGVALGLRYLLRLG